MKLSELSPEALQKISGYRYDQLIEKHEGPWNWSDCLKYEPPEFFPHEGFDLLLPIVADRNQYLSIHRLYHDPVQEVLTVFLEDSIYPEVYGYPAPEPFLAVLFQVPGETFYLANFYHSMYRIALPEVRPISRMPDA